MTSPNSNETSTHSTPAPKKQPSTTSTTRPERTTLELRIPVWGLVTGLKLKAVCRVCSGVLVFRPAAHGEASDFLAPFFLCMDCALAQTDPEVIAIE